MHQLGLWGPACPPTVRTVTATIRGLNRVLDGPIAVTITAKGLVAVASEPQTDLCYGRETLPGSDQPFNAVGVARRLLAALRDLEPAA
jgi:hypothetical protein